MSYFLQPKRVKYRITLVIVGSLLEVTTSPTSPELTIGYPTFIDKLLLHAMLSDPEDLNLYLPNLRYR
ncbi:hypothetical protein [Candidatus Tisiphia endosymbiont of Sialis lutaria]|uniref:hypothetical protein n=1 Tax=Candidatus Tisiphia endosymbiont of Sialis lutaria TaxID=2029164 RepID=UPI00312C7DB1